MKRIILLGILFLASCKKEDDKQDSAAVCDCYEVHESQQAYVNGYGTINLTWKYLKTTPTQPDLCAKETGQYVYSSNGATRFKVYCD